REPPPRATRATGELTQPYILFDTREKGNGNNGHTYGTQLSNQDKENLLEYLKTLSCSQHIRKIGRQSSADDNGQCSVTLVSEPALLSRKVPVRLPVLRQFRSCLAANRKLGCPSI